MKFRILLVCLLSAFLAPAISMQAQDKDKETPLGAKMDNMNKALRVLKRQVADASKNDDSVAQAATIRQNAVEAEALIPAKAADLPEADRAKFTEGYKAKMDELIKTLDQLTAALKANDNATAQKLVAEIGAEEKDGHKDYRKQKKRPAPPAATPAPAAQN